jgi:HAD superfamily hydrolase (TIGR01549 family)
MGGDQLVPHLAGDDVDARLGDRIRDAEAAAYQDYLPHVRPFSDALPFLEAARALDIEVVLASSSKPAELDRYLELLQVERLGVSWTSTAYVSNTKPAPDIIESALALVNGADAVMVGDATWDVLAAERAGIETIAMLTGGYGADELLGAGAVAVYARLEKLTAALPSWFERAASPSRLGARNPT